jgi:Tol biopolymer transport system component
MRASVKIAVGVAASIAAVLLAPAALATFPGATNGRIAFERGGNIWVMNPNGSGQIRLTSTGTAADPQWSPAGRRIAFDQRSSGTGSDVWIMNADGSNKRRITTHPDDEWDPAWSPDGEWLAFTSNRNNDRGEIFKVRTVPPIGPAVRLTRVAFTGEPDITPENPYLYDSEPSWSPSGARIVFSRFERSDTSSFSSYFIYLVTMDPDGSAKAVVRTGTGLGATCPSWGPGSKRIVWVDDEFEFELGLESNNIWHTAPDGSRLTRVTHFTAQPTWDLGCPSWSPDRGRSIVFSGRIDDSAWGSEDPILPPAIYRVPSDGSSAPVLITRGGADPDWGPG